MVASVVRVAAAHPAATRDDKHVFSVLFAAATVGYLALALTPPRPSGRRTVPLWWALAGAAISSTAWTVAALSRHTPDTVAGYWWVGAVTTVAVSIGAAASTRDRTAGIQAGLLAIVLAMPVHFAIDIVRLLSLHDYSLTNPYDLSAFPHSGYPDAASYVLGDAIAGEILAGLVIYPIAMLALAVFGATATSSLHRSGHDQARPSAG
jgi:hypothetical protein